MPNLLIGSYQGPIEWPRGAKEWLILTVVSVKTETKETRFRYVLNSPSRRIERNDGQAVLAEGRIAFADLHGIIRADGGRLILRSLGIDGPPYWMLEKGSP